MEKLTKDQTYIIKADLDELLADYGKKVGMVFNLGTMTCTDKSFRVKLSGTISDNSNPVSAEERMSIEFKIYAVLYGLTPEDLGKEVQVSEKTYKIVGIKPNNKKYPLIMQDQKGHNYKFAVHASILKQLGH